ESALSTTRTGGTPYGASHVAQHDRSAAAGLSADEKALAAALGVRLARAAAALSSAQAAEAA
ncbi:TPA: NAD(P)H:quinone oxidoreductase, partial [Burkholderia contaminans]